MYNSCINPCQSLGYRASHSLSFSDYHSSCFLNDRTLISSSPNSSSCCCCCCCCGCSNSVYKLPINPSLLFGLRQSTLIQWSPVRRLSLIGRNQCISRFSVHDDIDRSFLYEKYGSFKERCGGRKGEMWGKGRYGRMVYEERDGEGSLGNVADEVEMMLSLLTEEVGEEFFGDRERNGWSSWKVKVEDRKKEKSDGISYRSGKKNVGSIGFKSSSKRDQEDDGARYREKVKREKEEREKISRCEDCKSKIEGSTSKSNEKYDITRYREETKVQKEDKREEGIEKISRSENRRARKEETAWKSNQEYDTTRYMEEIKRQKEHRRVEARENLSRIENLRLRKEESAWKRDQEYDINRYREEIKRQKEDRREEERENLSIIENRRPRNEVSILKSDQEYDTTRNRVEIKRQEEDRKDEVEDNILKSENRKVRKEGSTFRIYKEYDTAGCGEEIKRQRDDRREEERDNLSRSENCRLRKESSCSSYYSLSSANEFVSDSEVQVKDDTFVGQSSMEYKTDQSGKEYIRYDGEVKEKEKNAERFYEETSGAEHDWRKKSEKKVNEVVIEQAKSRKKLAEENMRLSKIEQQSYVQRSDIQQQYIDKREKLTFDVNINVGTSEHHTLNDDRISGQSESRIKHKQFNEKSELDSSVVETSSSSQKQYSGAEKNESTSMSLVEETNGAFSETAGHFSRQDAHRWESEQITTGSKIEETYKTGDSSSLSEKRMKKLEDNSQQTMGISEFEEIGIGSTPFSQMKADIRMKKQEEKSESAYLEAKFTDAQMISPKTANRQEKLSTSLVKGKVTDTQRISKTSIDTEEMASTSVVELVDERRRHSLTGKGELQIEPLKTLRKPLKASSFNEGMPKEVSSSYKSLKLIPESSVQQIGADDDDKRSSRPPSKFSSESFTSGLSEVQAQREESSSTVGSDIYGGDIKDDSREENLDFISHEDVLDSAERLQQSSTHFVNETRVRHSLVGKGELQNERLKTIRRPVKASSFNEGMPKEVSNSYKSLKLIPESSAQQIGADDDDKRSSRPPSEFSSASFRSGLSELQAQREENSSVVGSEVISSANPLDLITHEDALGSADRLHQSSTHFVEKVRQEVLTSGSQKENITQDTKFMQGKEEDKRKGISQEGSGHSRLSSRGSGAKGPSDEMWHIDQTNQGPHVIKAVQESSESTSTTTESGIIRRSGRSFWNVIGDIARLRWNSSRSETHITRSGGKNSSNQSTGSEAWFSGHEADENNGENLKKEDAIFLQETSSSEKQQSGGIHSVQELSSPVRSRDKINQDRVDSSSFSSAEDGLPLKAGSLPSVVGTSSGSGTYKGELPLNAGSLPSVIGTSSGSGTFKGELPLDAGSLPSVIGTSSGSGTSEQSFPVPAVRMRRSPAVNYTSEASQASSSGSDKMVNKELSDPTLSPEVSVTDAKEGKLKQRKFQRSDHVLKDRFDEWEEAHTIETEQRKIDEMFMREALLEARKGADMWEVPVGAVLVQNGKIIARGYNLVEDMRDSTAHAEMICIREASNVLRTWRLSETTLYVTLEPCPMCAGAILQARVDTVVWGAPNKLLGADGSWIRLFPNGSGGNDSELGEKAAAGPVHPFHPNIIIRRGVLSSECADVMQQFFQLRRKNKQKKTDQPPTPPSGDNHDGDRSDSSWGSDNSNEKALKEENSFLYIWFWKSRSGLDTND